MDSNFTSALSVWSAFYFCELAEFQVSSTVIQSIMELVPNVAARLLLLPKSWKKID